MPLHTGESQVQIAIRLHTYTVYKIYYFGSLKKIIMYTL